MDRWKIGDLRRSAKGNLRRNFLACFIVCLLLTFISDGPMSITQTVQQSESFMTTASELIPVKWVQETLDFLITGFDKIRNATALGDQSSAGAIHSIYSLVSEAGSFTQILANFTTSLVNKQHVSEFVAICISAFSLIFVRVFVIDLMNVGRNRFFLENRIYSNTKVSNILYIYRIKRIWHVALILIVKYIFHILWSLTIVGFFIKRYSYYMVPFIVAENPDIPIKSAVTLSKKMMHGHKWHTFLFELSFIPWYLLSLLTFGILDYLYVIPYLSASKAELYTAIRAQAIEKKIPNYEQFDDEYLFVVPADTDNPTEYDDDEEDMRTLYPTALHKLSLSKGREWLNIKPKAHYSIINLVFMFFIFSFIGWAWECLLEYYKLGYFVNRGTMWGPWVPIYGTGGLMMIIFLNRFAKKPVVAFFLGVVIAGIMEYATATYLWYTHHLKYWDYTGYFLNIQGRICLEGLLFFGIMGLTGIYFFAPLSDNLLEKIPLKIRKGIAAALIVIFVADKVVVSIDPRTGEGITYEHGEVS